MAQNYIAPGDVLAVVLTAAITSGAPVLVGDLLGIAEASGAIGDTVSVMVEGVFAVKKKTTAVVAQGVKLYWDATNAQLDITDNSLANKWVGWAYNSGSATATTIQIRLIG